MVSKRPICLRCFAYDHHRSECKNDPVISCSTCFGLNYLTRDCCNLPRRPDDEYCQSFRMVGKEKTKFFMDFPIGTKMVAALIDTNRTRTVFDWAVPDKLYTENATFRFIPPSSCVIDLPRPNPASLNCRVSSLPGDLRIIVGMDYLSQRHVEIKFNGVKLSPQVNGSYARSATARYNINIDLASRTYPSVIDTTYTYSLFDVSLLNFIKNQPLCYYNYRTRLCNVPVTWKGKTVEMVFRVQRSIEHRVILGTDCCKAFGFEFNLDGVSLNINNPWKTDHQDAIQFAYNHAQGSELMRIMKTERLPRRQDTFRSIVQLPNEHHHGPE